MCVIITARLFLKRCPEQTYTRLTKLNVSLELSQRCYGVIMAMLFLSLQKLTNARTTNIGLAVYVMFT